MFCAKCGESNVEGAAFCKKCGAPISQPIAAGAGAPASVGQPAPARVAPAQESCVTAAWNDIRSTPDWFKKVLLLCLLGVVPVLNFAVEGYVLRWSRELSFGERTSMPKEIFKKREISTGFFAWLIRAALFGVFAVVTTLATWFLAGLVGMANAAAAAGLLVILAFACWVFQFFFFSPLVNVSVLRMAVVDYLESGFNIGKAWKSFRKNMGSAIGTSVLPPIIIGIVEVLVVIIGFAIIGAIITAMASSVVGSYSGYSSYGYGYGHGSSNPLLNMLSDPQDLIGAIIGAGYGTMFLVSVVIILVLMLNTFSMMLVSRAMGHWVARTAPEWADESDTAHLVVGSADAPAAPLAAGNAGATNL